MLRNSVFKDVFYPGNAKQLTRMLEKFCEQVHEDSPVPKAVIAPHAAYIYSGQTAAHAFKCLQKTRDIHRVIVLAPSHQDAFEGVAVTKADVFQTPLGHIAVNQKICDRLVRKFDSVHLRESAFDREHALEVELPFLQYTLHRFELIPLILGSISYKAVSKMLLSIWGDEQTLIVVSSDLSHYQTYQLANQIDQSTKRSIEHLAIPDILFDQACGQTGIVTLMSIAKQKKMRVKCVDLCNSGDTAGDRDRVVGYGAFHFYDNQH
jgi:AmmeMemoRadiSam system protein B